MIRVLIESDIDLIKVIVLNETVFKECREDGDVLTDEFIPDFNGWAYIGCFIDDKIVALQEVRSINKSTLELHFRSLPEIRGRKALIFAKETVSFIFDKMSVNKLNIVIPVYCKNVKRFTLMCGFEEEGIIKECFFKNSQYWDQWLLGLTRSNYERL